MTAGGAELTLHGISIAKDAKEKRIKEERKIIHRVAGIHNYLYDCIVQGNWDKVKELMSDYMFRVTDKITNNGNTILHIAVNSGKSHELLEILLEQIPVSTQLVELKNSDGSTLLHVAAIVGSTRAVNILVSRARALLIMKDNKDQTPLAIALSNMHTETSWCLLNHVNTRREKNTLFAGANGDKHLVLAISSKEFGLAHELQKNYCHPVDSEAVLMAIAQNFPLLNFWESITASYHREILHLFWRICRGVARPSSRCVSLCGYQVAEIWPYLYNGFMMIHFLYKGIPVLCAWPFVRRRVANFDDSKKVLTTACDMICSSIDPSSHHLYYTNPFFEAVRQDAIEVVKEILYKFPDAVWGVNEDGHNIIQYAVINRSENIYNILPGMREPKNIYKTIEDSLGNNLLHLAARLAPATKLNLISGGALQLQYELQWYKEVERYVCPSNITKKNSSQETPQMVFTRTHKELVTNAEKWMKATTRSYTVIAALITTIVFTAAVTVPGGNNQDTGVPFVTNNPALTVFAISDTISLFTALTSLLVFLSIPTEHFTEQDFLYKLPRKLLSGLATLFISMTAMNIAFGATLFVVFGQKNYSSLIPIAALITCLPVTSFVTLQFPLVANLTSSMYGRSIFGRKVSRSYSRPFYV